MGYRVGVDIGGSFTDFAVFDEDNGEIKSLKVFSRPDQPGEEVIAGVRMLGERYGIQPEQITYFTHGTTVGINTVIQRKGLKLALFTTENFSDVLELARLKTPTCITCCRGGPRRWSSAAWCSASPSAWALTARCARRWTRPAWSARSGRRWTRAPKASWSRCCTPTATRRMNCACVKSPKRWRPACRCRAPARPGPSSASTSAPSPP